VTPAVIAGAGCHCRHLLSLRPPLSLPAPAVIADLIRNPVSAWHWIPDQVRDDKQRVQDDKLGHGMTTEVFIPGLAFAVAHMGFVIACLDLVIAGHDPQSRA